MTKNKSILVLLLLISLTLLIPSCKSSNDQETAKLRKEIEELKKEKNTQNKSTPNEKKDPETGKTTPEPESKTTPKPDPKPKAQPITELKFSDYPARDVYSGKNQPLVLDEFAKNFKARLSAAIKNQKPTFAGHYLVAGWGCGSSGCNTGAIINAKTGRAYPFPVSLSSVSTYDSDGVIVDDFQGHEYKLNSRLMIFSGNLEGSKHGDGSDTVEFYEFKDGKFVFLKSKPYGKSK